MAIDLSRMTAHEREIYKQGLADSKTTTVSASKTIAANGTVEAATKSNWRSSEYMLVVAVTAFGMWCGYMAIMNADIEMDRVLTIMAAVSGLAGYYTSQRSAVKKEAVRAAGAEGQG